MPAPTYIISKVADPIFAVFIGLSAAATRINREGKENGIPTSETVAAGKRRLAELSVQLLPFQNSSTEDQSRIQERLAQRYRLNEEEQDRRKLAAQHEKKA